MACCRFSRSDLLSAKAWSGVWPGLIWCMARPDLVYGQASSGMARPDLLYGHAWSGVWPGLIWCMARPDLVYGQAWSGMARPDLTCSKVWSADVCQCLICHVMRPSLFCEIFRSKYYFKVIDGWLVKTWSVGWRGLICHVHVAGPDLSCSGDWSLRLTRPDLVYGKTWSATWCEVLQCPSFFFKAWCGVWQGLIFRVASPGVSCSRDWRQGLVLWSGIKQHMKENLLSQAHSLPPGIKELLM